MELGSALLLFGLDVELLQGTLNFLYENLPPFRTVEDPAGGWRLELDQPQLETRTEGVFRLGVHLSGGLFLGDDPDARVFDAWVRLRPEVSTDDDAFPVGTLRFDGVEEVVPALAEQAVANAFGPEGPIGSALDGLSLDVFRSLLEGAQDQLVGGGDVDLSAFSTAFYLGRPAPIPRPVWAVRREGDGYQPVLDLDVSYATTPALVASVALAGADPVPPDAPSVVRPGTGLGLVTAAAVFDARFARESSAVVGTELEGLTIDRLEVRSTDYGFDVDGEGHKTGAEVDFAGSLVAQYRGGVGGELAMRSTVETDVDTAWWVDLLSVVAAVVPVIGWILGDIFIWGPEQEAPGKVEAALLEKFSEPLADTARQVADRFAIDIIPTNAFLADVWFFDANMAVAAAAFAGTRQAEVRAVSHDVAYLSPRPEPGRPRTNRRRPVTSVEEITLTSGHTLKPWQAGQLVAERLLRIPGHHAVRNPRATHGIYLRSDPDDTSSNNLLA